MLADEDNSQPSHTKVNGGGARASLDVPYGRIALVMGCMTLWFLVLPLSASPQDITIRLINATSGKPLSKISVSMGAWNGTFDVRKGPYPEQIRMITDAEGRAVFHLPRPTPEHIGFSVGTPWDFAGCWHLRDSSPETVLRSGVVADYDETKCGKRKPKIQVSAKPGEVVIFERKLTLWEKMHRELP